MLSAQFNGGHPEHQHCERYRIVFQPNTHDTPTPADTQLGPVARISAGVLARTFGLGEASRHIRSTPRLVSLTSSFDVSGSRRLPVQAASSGAPEHKSETQQCLFLFLRTNTYATWCR